MIINRDHHLERIKFLFKVHPIVGLLGPRQSGKTTMAKIFAKSFKGNVHYFDLEDPAMVEILREPKTTLYNLEGLIIIDEIQRRPELFPTLRFIIDNRRDSQQYLILGSASRDMIKQSSESLAGRIGYEEIHPFNAYEVPDTQKLFLRGGFPNAYLAGDDKLSSLWLDNYIRTFLEHDIPTLGIDIPAPVLRKFWVMLSHYHGNIFNASEIGKSLGISDKTIKYYLDILSGTFMIRQLQPWYENIQKRQVKRPKIFFRDSGIFHRLLNIETSNQLITHPKVGASWEGFAMEQVIRKYGIQDGECYFWGVHQEAELDLLIFHNGKRLGFEFKYADAPKITKSIRQSIEHLSLDHLYIIYPGELRFKLEDNIECTNLLNLS